MQPDQANPNVITTDLPLETGEIPQSFLRKFSKHKIQEVLGRGEVVEIDGKLEFKPLEHAEVVKIISITAGGRYAWCDCILQGQHIKLRKPLSALSGKDLPTS